jgi:hypothetical protein
MGRFFKWVAGLTAGIMLAYGVATSYSFAKTPNGFSMTSKSKPNRTIEYDTTAMKLDYKDNFKSTKNNLDTVLSYDFKSKTIGGGLKDNLHSIDSKVDFDTGKKTAAVNVNIPRYSLFTTLEKDAKYNNIVNKYVKDAAVYTPIGNFYHTR